MNRTEKITLQAKNKHQVLAFKEGFFYKVYNEGAYLLQDKHYKLQSNGKVNSKSENGTSNSIVDYVYFDVNVKSITKKTVYYRLTQYDYDGANETFEIKSLNVTTKDLSIVRVYPNPANDVLTYEVNGNIKGKEVSVILKNVLGVEVYGYSTLSAENNYTGTIDMNNLPAGMYIAKIGYGTDFQTKIIMRK